MKKPLFRRLLLLVACMLLSIPAVFAQNQVTVKGKILDAEGQPVIGASILQKGHEQSGVTTDLDGNFSIVVPGGTVLQISSIGFVTREVTAAPQLSIVLEEDVTMLEETVVVGYGTQKKASLTSAISNIRSEELTATKQSDVLASLQGKVSGRATPVTSTPTSSSAAMTNRSSSWTVSSGPLPAGARRTTPPTPTAAPPSWPCSIRRTSKASPS